MPRKPDRWLLLVHQLPAKPDYLRVKIGRRLARLGAVALKNSVYLLPDDPERIEDLQWLLQEIRQGGGEGTLASARLLGGLDDARAEELFRAARDADCAPLIAEGRALLESGAPTADDLARLRRRHDELAAIDFFDCTGRVELDGVLRALAARLEPAAQAPPGGRMEIGKTWVTRRGIKVDRMACAWLIRRFIDPQARFKFVEARGYLPEPGELRFDMFDAEYTHEGDACTFEVLIRRFGLRDPALDSLAELVHDIDLKDGKFGRAEAAGVAMMIDAIAAAHPGDEVRLARASVLWDELYGLAARARV
ncbi:chromate resistance protein [Myxococcota bacterium]|nr:chromate resistance protein [Myxococcota bacterium]